LNDCLHHRPISADPDWSFEIGRFGLQVPTTPMQEGKR
jgi:hypothetical protein